MGFLIPSSTAPRDGQVAVTGDGGQAEGRSREGSRRLWAVTNPWHPVRWCYGLINGRSF